MYWKSILGVVLVGMVGLGCTSTQKVVQANSKLDTMVNNRTLKIEVNAAEPFVTTAMAQIANSGMLPPGNTISRIDVKGSGYFIQIDGDTVSADLPYYGERQMGGGYGEDAGIKFDGEVAEFDIGKDSVKQGYNIRSSVTDGVETYMINIDISPNMNSDVRVSSSHRNRIRYTGKVVEVLE